MNTEKTSRYRSGKTARVLRVGLNLLAACAAIAAFLFAELLTVWGSCFIFLVVLAGEVAGRWLFYRQQPAHESSR